MVAEVTMSKLTVEMTVEGDKEYGCGGDGRGDGSEFGGGPGGGDTPVIKVFGEHIPHVEPYHPAAPSRVPT